MEKGLRRIFYSTDDCNVNYPGMFDLIKGYAMIWIIVGHVDSLFNNLMVRSQIFDNVLTDFFIKIIGLEYATIPVFLIISGYGFRTTSIGKCLKKQAKSLLVPYAITATITVGLLGLVRLFIYREGIRLAIKNIFFDLLSYMLGTTYTISFMGNYIFNISTVWFLLALFLAWNLLNVIMNLCKGIWRHIAIVVCVLAGIVLGRYVTLPFCIAQALLSVGYLYVGVLVKHYDLFSVKIKFASWFVFGGVLIIGAKFPVSIYSGYVQSTVGYMINCVYAFVFIYIFLLIAKYNFPFKDCILKLGRYSLWLMCINSVISTSGFWYLVIEHFGTESYVVCLMVLIAQIIVTYIAYKTIYCIDKAVTKRKREAKKARRHANA